MTDDFEPTPPRLTLAARADVVRDMASDVAVFGMVFAVGALIVVAGAVLEAVEWFRDGGGS